MAIFLIYQCADAEAQAVTTFHGFITVSVTYRLSWQAVFPAQLLDVQTAIRWLRANAAIYHIDPARIGVYGFSAGAHLASLLGVIGDQALLAALPDGHDHTCRVQAVVTAAGPSDFSLPGGHIDQSLEVERLFGGSSVSRAELMRLASPVTHVHADAPPFLIIHGTADDVVPFAHAERLYTALTNAGADAILHAMPDVDHSWSMGWNEIAQQYLAFFQHHLAIHPGPWSEKT